MMENNTKLLLEIGAELKTMAAKIERLLASEETQSPKQAAAKSVSKPAPQKPNAKLGKDKVKTEAVKKEVIKEKPKPVKQPLTSTEQVLRIINMSKKSIDFSTLKEKTGFNADKINAILYRLTKENKIKRLSKGVYAKV